MATGVYSQERIKYSINSNWNFHQGGLESPHKQSYRGLPVRMNEIWQKVSLPHTWNSCDPFDDDNTYYRGIGWYTNECMIDSMMEGRELFLYFEGVNQVAEVYVNGAFVGEHMGGYTAFCLNITDNAVAGVINHIAVKVDNSHNPSIPPLSVGYALYGGIYRDVWIIGTDRVHFDLEDHASSGVYITTDKVSGRSAEISLKYTVVNDTGSDRDLEVVHTVSSRENGTLIKKVRRSVSVPAGEKITREDEHIMIQDPRLWSPGDPFLYKVKSEILTDGKIVDEVTNPLGFRWYRFDPARGFFLNDQKLVLKGTNRHQDLEGKGSALSNAWHRADLKYIKDMGANFLRLAHYPQDPEVLRTADELGLLIWEEIPLVNHIDTSASFEENTKRMVREMIRQHYNHPSIIMWGSCNEIYLMDQHGNRASVQGDGQYASRTAELVYQLDRLIREEDPSRVTTLAMHISDDYRLFGIDTIAMVNAYNIYNGWYSGSVDGFGEWLDKMHHRYPDRPIFISEYGAGGDTRINSLAPERFDFSNQYQLKFHESYLQQIKDRQWLAGTAIWSQNDFSQPNTGGTLIHLNQKGVQMWDRKFKDLYFLYKANWHEEPVLYIADRYWKDRVYIADSRGNDSPPHARKHTIRVYSNAGTVELLQNFRSLGKKDTDRIGVAEWEVILEDGANYFLAETGKGSSRLQDCMQITLTRQESDLSSVHEICINAGNSSFFTDEEGLLWLPDREFVPYTYGHTGGERKMVPKDLTIFNANGDLPLYNYYMEGLDRYRVDLSEGKYFVELFFMEPDPAIREGERLFDIFINGTRMFNDLDIFSLAGFGQALQLSCQVECKGSDGLVMDFISGKGKSILCALKISRK